MTMILNPKAKLLGMALMLATTIPASAQYDDHRDRGPRDMVESSRQTGGYCDQGGCPDRFWRYRIYYGPVFFHGQWYRGPVYVKDDNGRHYFWVRGGWHRDEWQAQRPVWARNGYFGPALPRDYYQAHNFGGDQRGGDSRNGRVEYDQRDQYQGMRDGRDNGGYQVGSKQPDRGQYANGDNQQGDPRRSYRQDAGPQGQYNNGNGNYQQRPDRGPSNMQGQGDPNGPYGRRDNAQGQAGPAPGGQQPSDNRFSGRNGNGQNFANNGQPGTIGVTAATYGASCKQPAGNVTKFLADACNGKTSCDYVIKYQTIGDPAPGCAKDFSVQWTCSTGVGGTANAAAEAGFGSPVRLQCTANGR
jgi:hypothetical protein